MTHKQNVTTSVKTTEVRVGTHTASFIATHTMNGVPHVIMVTFRQSGAPVVFGIPHMNAEHQQRILNTYRNLLVRLQYNSEQSEALRNCDVRLT